MTGLAKTLFFGTMQSNGGILRRNLLITLFRDIKNRQAGRFNLLGAVKQVNYELVNTRIPQRLGNKDILEQLAVFR